MRVRCALRDSSDEVITIHCLHTSGLHLVCKCDAYLVLLVYFSLTIQYSIVIKCIGPANLY